jgi:hypothetical protein
LWGLLLPSGFASAALAALLGLLEAFPGDQGLMILAGVKGLGLANFYTFFCRAGIGDHSCVDGVGEDVADGVGVEGLGGRQAGAAFGPEVDELAVSPEFRICLSAIQSSLPP